MFTHVRGKVGVSSGTHGWHTLGRAPSTCAKFFHYSADPIRADRLRIVAVRIGFIDVHSPTNGVIENWASEEVRSGNLWHGCGAIDRGIGFIGLERRQGAIAMDWQIRGRPRLALSLPGLRSKMERFD